MAWGTVALNRISAGRRFERIRDSWPSAEARRTSEHRRYHRPIDWSPGSSHL